MESFEQILYQLHLSYLQARKNKRNTRNQLKFEIDQETNLYQLAKAICDRTYIPKPGIAFIIHKPVMREIFAADFSDRIIHHLIYRCIYPIIDRKLIHDTYSCRVGKGTLYGVHRAKKFMRSCSRNFSREAFVLKVDIEAYFMNMKHGIIYDKVVELLPEDKTGYFGLSRDTLLYLLRQTIFNKVTENCRIKGCKSDWAGLPPSKSLFNYADDTGLPIGNLTSQVFGNVYLYDLDHYVKKVLREKYYARYVDDMLFVHDDKDHLFGIIAAVQEQISAVGLRLHPKKIVMKPIEEGVPFLGHIIKPYRSYISNRTKNNFYQAIKNINKTMAVEPQFTWQQLCEIRATLNSYLGVMQHANTFNLRKAMLDRLAGRFYDFFSVCKELRKVTINKDFWEWHFSPSYRFTN